MTLTKEDYEAHDRWVAQLKADFPAALSGHLPFGIECGKGWDKPIRQALATFEACGAKILQWKEKFGVSRVYYNLPQSADIWQKIACRMADDQATSLSAKTCETCGQPGEAVLTGGWRSTLCKICRKTNSEPMGSELI